MTNRRLVTAPLTTTALAAALIMVAAVPAGAAPTSRASQARKDVQLSCNDWSRGESTYSYEANRYYDPAVKWAYKAARLSPHWAPLYHDFRYVAALPETGNSVAVQKRAQKDIKNAAVYCRSVGTPLKYS